MDVCTAVSADGVISHRLHCLVEICGDEVQRTDPMAYVQDLLNSC
jgi:hypothetical protein